MDGRQGKLSNSLRFRLAASVSTIVVALALVAGALSFWTAFEEANEWQDEQLRQMAALIDRNADPGGQVLGEGSAPGPDQEQKFVVQVLGVPLGPSPSAVSPPLSLPAELPDGMQTLSVGGESWRVFVKSLRSGAQLAVGQQTAVRDETAHSSALRTVLPLLVLVPCLLVAVGVVVRQALKPVVALSGDLDRRAEPDLSSLRDDDVPDEIRPFTASINRLLARVASAMQSQRRFVADAAHELRSPLTALALQAEALAGLELPLEAREQVARLRLGMKRTRTMLDQLLTLARFDASPATAGLSAISVLAALRGVIEEQMPLADMRQIDLGIVSGDTDMRLCVRDVELHAIVRNLIDNALRFTPPGGRVDVELRRHAGGLALEVADTGPGIAVAERARVFDAFYRVLGTETEGSGLGLSIVKTLANRMGAAVTLYDVTPGVAAPGLRVVVAFPSALVVA
jgi:two-component system OmpR family sensor kinase